MDRVLIVGGDIILNLVLAKIAAGQGFAVSILGDNKANSFFFDSYFTTKAGGRYLKGLGLADDKASLQSAEAVLMAILINLSCYDLDISYYGADFRFVDKSGKSPNFKVMPRASREPTQIDELVYGYLKRPTASWLKYLPRLLKQRKIHCSLVAFTSTVPFIKGVSLRRDSGLLIHEYSMKNAFISECAKHQVEDTKGGENIKSGFKRYQKDLHNFPVWLASQ